MAGLGRTIPALPVKNIGRAVECFSEKFGFDAVHVAQDFAVLSREDARIHLWAADDEGWTQRTDLLEQPVRSGAESFLAGTASCRIEVAEPDALHEELAGTGVIHPRSREGVRSTDFGTREFACLDLDGNLIEFFRWTT
jgi:catechol 2,3-dioxygenase-like lactoylglutathione lyase family enzyme